MLPPGPAPDLKRGRSPDSSSAPTPARSECGAPAGCGRCQPGNARCSACSPMAPIAASRGNGSCRPRRRATAPGRARGPLQAGGSRVRPSSAGWWPSTTWAPQRLAVMLGLLQSACMGRLPHDCAGGACRLCRHSGQGRSAGLPRWSPEKPLPRACVRGGCCPDAAVGRSAGSSPPPTPRVQALAPRPSCLSRRPGRQARGARHGAKQRTYGDQQQAAMPRR